MSNMLSRESRNKERITLSKSLEYLFVSSPCVDKTVVCDRYSDVRLDSVAERPNDSAEVTAPAGEKKPGMKFAIEFAPDRHFTRTRPFYWLHFEKDLADGDDVCRPARNRCKITGVFF